MRIFGFEIYRPSREGAQPGMPEIGWEAFTALQNRLSQTEAAILTQAGWTRKEDAYNQWYAPENYQLDSPIDQDKAMIVQSVRVPE